MHDICLTNGLCQAVIIDSALAPSTIYGTNCGNNLRAGAPAGMKRENSVIKP